MIISIVRRPEGLFALHVTGNATFAVPDNNAPLDSKRIFEESFALITTKDIVDFSRLQNSLEMIRVVEKPSSEVLTAVLDILVNTVAGSSAFLNKPVFSILSNEPDETTRSAANPRGFKGTKYKPPKKKSLGKKDLLHYLDGGQNESSVLQWLSEHLNEAIALCIRAEKFGPIIKKNGIYNLRPFGQTFPKEMIDQIALLPKKFHKYFAWLLRGLSESQIGQMIYCYWTFELEKNDQLCLIIAMMIRESPTDNCIQWILSMEATSSLRLNCLAEILLESNIFQMYHEDCKGLISRLEALCSDHEYRHRAFYLLKQIRGGHSAEYFFDGFRLANKYESDYKFTDEMGDESVFSVVEQIMPSIKDHPDSDWVWNLAPMWVWKSCGFFTGYSALIKSLDLKSLGPETAFSVICSIRSIQFLSEDEDLIKKVWASIKIMMPAYIDILKKMSPSYHQKSLSFFDEAIALWYNCDLDAALKFCFQIMGRLCKSPFDKGDNIREPIFSFLRVPSGEWPAICETNDHIFLYLEKKCLRDNDARLIGLGLWPFAHCMPNLAVRSFQSCISNFCRTMKELGCLNYIQCKRILRELSATPLFQDNYLALSHFELVQLVEDSFDEPSPFISKRLRNHMAGNKILSQKQESRDVERILASWSEVLLSKINEYILQVLKQDLHPDISIDDSKSRHALMIQSSVEENRRALRKMIRAHLNGSERYITDHPISKEWFAKHPKIDQSLWMNGITLPKSACLFNLALEQDPFEVLRMGTYVGSCLGLGGKLTFSAAAIALDVNKQVIYCRDEKGSVLARQLVAIAEEEELYCFDVYPDSATSEIKKMFWQFDTLFASALNIPLHDPGKEYGDGVDEYNMIYGVKSLLSKGWWDDYPVAIQSE